MQQIEFPFIAPYSRVLQEKYSFRNLRDFLNPGVYSPIPDLKINDKVYNPHITGTAGTGDVQWAWDSGELSKPAEDTFQTIETDGWKYMIPSSITSFSTYYPATWGPAPDVVVASEAIYGVVLKVTYQYFKSHGGEEDVEFYEKVALQYLGYQPDEKNDFIGQLEIDVYDMSTEMAVEVRVISEVPHEKLFLTPEGGQLPQVTFSTVSTW